MSDQLKQLIEAARKVPMTPEQQKEQRLSFAYGSAKLASDAISVAHVVRASEGANKSQQHVKPAE